MTPNTKFTAAHEHCWSKVKNKKSEISAGTGVGLISKDLVKYLEAHGDLQQTQSKLNYSYQPNSAKPIPFIQLHSSES